MTKKTDLRDPKVRGRLGGLASLSKRGGARIPNQPRKEPLTALLKRGGQHWQRTALPLDADRRRCRAERAKRGLPLGLAPEVLAECRTALVGVSTQLTGRNKGGRPRGRNPCIKCGVVNEKGHNCRKRAAS